MAEGQGWEPNPDAVAEFVSTLPHATFGQALDGGLVKDDKDALLYRAIMELEPALVKDGRLISRNQGRTGSCVGYGGAAAGDVTTATEIVIHKQKERWVARQSADACYAFGREISGNLGGGDGSYGAASAKAVTQWGTVHMIKYGELDLTKDSDSRAKEWGRRGAPSEIKEEGKSHKFGTAALVKTVDEARQAIQNGYGVSVCSGQGFASERDSDGFAKARGSWAHCMAWAGYRGGKRPGFLVWNSWGDNWISGPVWPEDQPHGSFWIDLDVAGKMLRGGDSFAYSDYAGFPRQSPWDWLRNPDKLYSKRKR